MLIPFSKEWLIYIFPHIIAKFIFARRHLGFVVEDAIFPYENSEGVK